MPPRSRPAARRGKQILEESRHPAGGTGYHRKGVLALGDVVAISDAMDMWRDQELYSPGMVPVTAAARARTSFGRWQVAGEVELPLLVRIHDAGLPDEVNPRRVSLVPNLTADIGYWPRRWLGLRLVGSLAMLLEPGRLGVTVARQRGACSASTSQASSAWFSAASTSASSLVRRRSST